MPTTTFSTNFGLCGLAWNDQGLASFRLPETELSSPICRTGDQVESIDHESAPDWIKLIIERTRQHFLGQLQDFSGVRYDFSLVTPFQHEIYKAALTVKAGTTQTYGWLAQASGYPISASRAVGTALGSNPWPLLVPCHRFVGASGKLTGFSAPGGISTKQRLLSLEGAELALF